MWYHIKDQSFGAPYGGFLMGYVIRYSDKGSLRGIRSLVSVPLTPDDLSDSVIDSSVFIRSAELETYKLLNIADDGAYAAKVGLTNYLNNNVLPQFPRQFIYEGAWSPNIRYAQNDVVRYTDTTVTPHTNTLYYAKQTFTSGMTFDSNNWNQIQVNFRGMWIANTAYLKEDVVYEGSNIYYANSNFTSAGTFTASNWTQIMAVSQTPAQRLSEERIKLAVQYLAAIKLIPALPQLLEEQILRERVRYQEIDWEKRLELYEQEVTSALEEETDTTIFATGAAVYGEIKQYVAF